MTFRNVQGQLARWLQKLQQYDFDVVHRAGKNHRNADALLRRPCLLSGCRFCQKQEDAEHLAITKEQQNVHQTGIATLRNENSDAHENTSSLNDNEKFQRLDEDLSVILSWIENNDGRPDWSVVAPNSRTMDGLNGLLWHPIAELQRFYGLSGIVCEYISVVYSVCGKE